MEHTEEQKHLHQYVTERLPLLVPGIFSGAPDLPDFSVDQRFVALEQPPYSV
jgi:hypothetical protein